MAQQQQAANNLHAQANDALSKVRELNAQIYAIQTQISLNQAQNDRVSTQIADAQAKMAAQKATLGENIKSMYLTSGVTPIEMLASSHNLSSFFDRQQYQDKVKDKIQATLVSIQDLKATLDLEQARLTKLIADQRDQKAQLDIAQAQANQLAALAAQNAAQADAQVRNSNAQINNVRAAQAAMFARLAGATSGSGSITFRNLSFGGACGGGYPAMYCNYETDAFGDQWGMYIRECVSYTAYRVAASGRTMPNWGGVGNATQWPGNAIRAGIPVDGSPRVGDVAIAGANMIGGVGHAMYVESIESGGWVHVSQYNWWPTAHGPYGLYSEMDLKVTPGLSFIHFR